MITPMHIVRVVIHNREPMIMKEIIRACDCSETTTRKYVKQALLLGYLKRVKAWNGYWIMVTYEGREQVCLDDALSAGVKP